MKLTLSMHGHPDKQHADRACTSHLTGESDFPSTFAVKLSGRLAPFITEVAFARDLRVVPGAMCDRDESGHTILLALRCISRLSRGVMDAAHAAGPGLQRKRALEAFTDLVASLHDPLWLRGALAEAHQSHGVCVSIMQEVCTIMGYMVRPSLAAAIREGQLSVAAAQLPGMQRTTQVLQQALIDACAVEALTNHALHVARLDPAEQPGSFLDAPFWLLATPGLSSSVMMWLALSPVFFSVVRIVLTKWHEAGMCMYMESVCGTLMNMLQHEGVAVKVISRIEELTLLLCAPIMQG